ncbi:MAG: DUF4097 domain-containing protein [Firmicutes bacterium]|jgi:DUF4097 and DUF4098 domain-containing protein YvlB|nr:DUF4097 domain-containing protein [Bacillota bacterium]
MRIWRTTILVALICLALLVSAARPWRMGTELLADRFRDSVIFNPGASPGMRGVAAHKRLAERHEADGVRTVVVDVPVGELVVEGSSDPSIGIEAELTGYGVDTDDARRRLEDITLSVEQQERILRITGQIPVTQTRGRSDRMDVTVRVPHSIAVQTTAGLGNLRVSGIDGDVTAIGRLGKVRVERTRGDITVRSDLGDVSVVDVEVQDTLDIYASLGKVHVRGALGRTNRIETATGSVDLEIPESTSLMLDASSSMGKLKTSFPVTGHKESGMSSGASGQLGTGTPVGSLFIRVSLGDISISTFPSR